MKRFFKSQLTSIKNIEKRNAAFEALSDEDKRKEIAWDALKLITMGIVSASYGHYWNNYLLSLEHTNLQKLLVDEKKLPKDCEVCVRGAIMLSQIRLGNCIGSDDEDRSNGDPANLKGFPYCSMKVLESEFENDKYGTPYGSNTTAKIANLMCNIIVNGNFDSNDHTDYLEKFEINL